MEKTKLLSYEVSYQTLIFIDFRMENLDLITKAIEKQWIWFYLKDQYRTIDFFSKLDLLKKGKVK